MSKSNFVKSGDDEKNYAASSPKGAVVEEGGLPETSRIRGSPYERVEEMRDIKDTDPHVNEGIETIVDWVCGDGYEIIPRKLGGVDSLDTTQEDAVKLRKLFVGSGFWNEMQKWVEHAATDGSAFLELVVEDERFKPRLLPTEKVVKKTDKFGKVEQYGLYPPDTNSQGLSITEMPDEAKTYEPHEIAELSFVKRPPEFFGRSLVEPIHEQANILRDMEIDYARFIATKAYPPILWTCGTEEEKWTEEQIEGWLDTVETIEPDSMIAAPHDVDHEVVGTTSTSANAGAMRLEETFTHFEHRVVTGLGVPSILMNARNAPDSPETVMPSFKRRITRFRNIVKDSIENQIFQSVLQESLDGEYSAVPEFKFGKHSSAEKRLEIDKLLKMFNNGFLTREAFAERAGIDPDTELPEDGELQDVIGVIHELQGAGDRIQNPNGGSPSDTGGGADTAGEEATSRNPSTEVDEDSRPRQSPTEDEDV
jgi:hypothetical protein